MVNLRLQIVSTVVFLGYVHCWPWSLDSCASLFGRQIQGLGSDFVKCQYLFDNSLRVQSHVIDGFCNLLQPIRTQCGLLKRKGNFTVKTCRQGARDCTWIPSEISQEICQVADSIVLFESNGLVCSTNKQFNDQTFIEASLQICQPCSTRPVRLNSFESSASSSCVASDFQSIISKTLPVLSKLCSETSSWIEVACESQSFITEWVDNYPRLFSDLQHGLCLIRRLAISMDPSCQISGPISATVVSEMSQSICGIRLPWSTQLPSTSFTSTTPTSTTKVTSRATTTAITAARTTTTTTAPSPTTTTTTTVTTTTTTRSGFDFRDGYCNIPLTPVNASISSISFECNAKEGKCAANGTVTFTCSQGYSIIGNDTLRCSRIDGFTWLPREKPTCRGCRIPEPPENGQILPNNQMCNEETKTCAEGSKLEVVCNYGYSTFIPINSNLKCVSGNTQDRPLVWDLPVPKCATCAIPKTPPNVEIDWYSWGCNASTNICAPQSSIQYRCELGWSLDSHSNIECRWDNPLRSPYWNRSPPQCSSCRFPVELPNQLEIVSWSDGCNYFTRACSEGSTLYLGCYNGYSTFGTAGNEMKCLRNSITNKLEWSSSLPRCVGCPIPEPPVNGMFDFVSFGCNQTSQTCQANNGYVQYSCKVGYTLLGSERQNCILVPGTTDGSVKWDREKPQCIACEIPTRPTFSTMATSNGCNVVENKCSRGASVYFTGCSVGNLVGATQLTCIGNSNLSWDYPPPRCV